jgi:IrrE N-terminal-like domain
VTRLSSPQEAAIEDAVRLAFREAEVPEPGEGAAVTPLDALLAAFPLCSAEIPELSRRSAVLHLQRLAPPFGAAPPVPLDDNEPLAGFLYGAPVQGEAWGCILVERGDIIYRRRFSVAHELGHYLLHFRPQVARMSADAHPTFVDGLGYKQPATEAGDASESSVLPEARLLVTEAEAPEEDVRERLEREANAFAAALLMPAPLCRRLVERYGGSLASAKRLASELLVSPAAMRVRLLDLGLLPSPKPEILQ